MAANRLGYPTPPPPDEDHTLCPVCGWKPCTSQCRLGLLGFEVSELEAMFWDADLPPLEGLDPDPFLYTDPEDFE